MRARALREAPTDAESLLWYHLRDRRLGNFKFRRQRPIGPYFADFACLEAELIVELDGGQHVSAAGYDENRTRFIETQGYRVLRFWNNEVLTQTDEVLERILQALQHTALTPALSRKREREQDNSQPSSRRTNEQDKILGLKP